MVNWCNVRLTVFGSPTTVRRFIATAKRRSSGVFSPAMYGGYLVERGRSRPGDWDVEWRDVVLTESGLVDALRIRTPTGERATVFVRMTGTGRQSSGHGKVLAQWGWSEGTAGEDAFREIAIPDGIPEGLSDFLNLHLWAHTAHWMLTRRE